MAINAYTGLPGSGKSYGVVENVILPALKAGRRVWTNIPMQLELIADMGYPPPRIFDKKDIEENPHFFQEVFEAGATIVIDEAWRFWPSGMKATNMIEGHKSFFAEHRHMVGEDGESTEVVLVTQDLSQIAATVRALVEFTYRSVKLNAVGLSTKFRIDIYQGAVTGPKPPVASRLRQIPGSYKPSIYKLYQSQTMSESSEHGNETISDKRTNILNNKFLLIGIPIIFSITLYFIYWAFSGVTESYTSGEKKDLVSDTGAVKSTVEVPPNKPEPQMKKSKTYNLLESSRVKIVYNNGNFPYIDYVFSLESRNSHARLTLHQMRKLGFLVDPISPCLVVISNQESIYYAKCENNSLPNNTDSTISSLTSIAS